MIHLEEREGNETKWLEQESHLPGDEIRDQVDDLPGGEGDETNWLQQMGHLPGDEIQEQVG